MKNPVVQAAQPKSSIAKTQSCRAVFAAGLPALLSGILMSIPFLLPCCGWVALFGLVPLLWMDHVASENGFKWVWLWAYASFVVWNALTTFWVCNATLGGGIFAVLANSLQMVVIFSLFRLSKKAFTGAVPYLFLAFAWVAWERYYLCWAQISWPWLVLGNAFARTLPLVQWYEYTGHLGGSLWVWGCNLAVFALSKALISGGWRECNAVARTAALSSTALLLFGPMALSLFIYLNYHESGEPLEVLAVQPNFDPYQKRGMNRAEQNAALLNVLKQELSERESAATAAPLLALAPETFINDVSLGHIEDGHSYRQFREFLKGYPGVNLLVGASTYEFINSEERPSRTARLVRENLWVETRNSAIMMDGWGKPEIFHKSKLVVGVEMTPYPAIFRPIDDWLGGMMGRDIGQDEISVLNVKSYLPDGSACEVIPIGCAICYESVYGEYCTGYVKKGAEALAVITNDAWWGDTPGYVQHCSYSSLRAIETRRDIVRCANTGISCIIDQRGRLVERTQWWEPAQIKSVVHLNDKETFFVRNGDVVGRICVLMFLLCFLGMIVRSIAPGFSK